MMKKIRMTACVLIFAMTVCLLAGCSNQNGNNMADEAREHRMARTETAGAPLPGKTTQITWKAEWPVKTAEPEMARVEPEVLLEMAESTETVLTQPGKTPGMV